MISAYLAILKAFNKAYTAWELINWVPFNSANPSLAPSLIGAQPNLALIAFASQILPLYHTSPSLIKGKNRLAKGAKSPEAPKEPNSRTTGNTLWLNISMIRSTVTNCTPDFPSDKACAFSNNIRRMISWWIGSPRLQACDITRLACNWLRSSLEILILHNEPKPVVMPYKGLAELSILWSR